MESDPTELRNVYGDSRYATVEANMKTELTRLRRRYKDL
ncbi:MAG: DUF4976 domain-containing protein [Acidobacteriota bacterium]|nr:DUF4976 domain-containing protein [Acidobacteriota bacterium]